MKAFEFIKEDQKKFNPSALLVWGGAFAVAIVSAASGLLLRQGYVEAFTVSNLLPGLLVLTPLLSSFWLYNQKGKYLKTQIVFAILFLLAVVVSFLQPQTEISLEKFSDPSRFWPETEYCFYLGVAISLLGSALILSLIWKFFPTPSHSKQVGLSLLCGVFGVAGLTFHCMGALKTHILYAHWGQAVLISSSAYLLQRTFFVRRIQKVLKLQGGGQIGNFHHLG